MDFRFRYIEPPETGNKYRKEYLDGIDCLIEMKYAQAEQVCNKL